MKSPLNISATAKRYGLDGDLAMKQQLIAFDNFIWQDCQIDTVEKLKAFEKGYQKHAKDFDFCYDTEVNEFSSVYMCDGEMPLLDKGAFQRTAESKGELHKKFIEAGLSELETVVIRTFLAEISGLYRKDAYYLGVPPFVLAVCETLNNGISKLPVYTKTVVRVCNEHDRDDFTVGDIFTPGFCLTCSADITWEDESNNRYRITPLDADHTKARKLFDIYNISEKQVTFLQDVQFIITEIIDWGEGKKEFLMNEMISNPKSKIKVTAQAY